MSVALTEVSEGQRERALERYRKLRPHLEQDAPLAGVAKEASLPLRTVQRWVGRYRQFGLIGQGWRWNVRRSAPAPFIGKSLASRGPAACRRWDITRSTT